MYLYKASAKKKIKTLGLLKSINPIIMIVVVLLHRRSCHFHLYLSSQFMAGRITKNTFVGNQVVVVVMTMGSVIDE
jgi:hypothetical protein